MQAPPELLAWMRQFGFKPDAIDAVAELRFDVAPTVAVTEANVKALEDVLQMSNAQVCPTTACRKLHPFEPSISERVCAQHCVLYAFTLCTQRHYSSDAEHVDGFTVDTQWSAVDLCASVVEAGG